MKFTILGEPIAKARPRFSKGRTYTPSKTINYENYVKLCYQEQCKEFLEGELQMEVKVYMQIPKSASKKKSEQMEAGHIRPTKRPDLDNIIKGIADALNGIAYKDDSQIVRVTVEKWYSYKARVEVEIKEV